MRGLNPWAASEPLGVLLLPRKLEDFELAAHARDLLDIPRVVAVEPPRVQRRNVFGGDIVAIRQARRLRFPGHPRVLVLYDPHQYHLARALSGKHEAELWYFRGAKPEPPEDEREAADLRLRDELAEELAVQTLVLSPSEPPRVGNEPIRQRMVELEIINSRPFVPGGRVRSR